MTSWHFKFVQWFSRPIHKKNKKKLYCRYLNLLFMSIERLSPLASHCGILHLNTLNKANLLSSYKKWDCMKLNKIIISIWRWWNLLQNMETWNLRFFFEHLRWYTKFFSDFSVNQYNGSYAAAAVCISFAPDVSLESVASDYCLTSQNWCHQRIGTCENE